MRWAIAVLGLLSVALSGVPTRGWAEAPGPAFAISNPAGIDEAGFVRIDGLDQWITIRGQDRANPVVLILHGGPGQAQSHLIGRLAPMEKDFVVVQWDQRGAGKTLARAGGVVDPAIDFKTMVADGLAVTAYLRGRLRRDRIVLLGFSWGSNLGVAMAERQPQAFAAYVGTGQAAETQPRVEAWVYQHLLERAAAAGDAERLAAMRSAGPPPWSPEALKTVYAASAPYRGTEISLAEGLKAALTAPHWTPIDIQALARGRSAYRETQLERDIAAFDPERFGRALAVPVIVIEGSDDLTTPAPFAEAWLRRLKAPKKAFATIPGAGHQAWITDNAAFSEILKKELGALRIPTR
jgi:pimeloyl-ACP methyl ester carboxylesterase